MLLSGWLAMSAAIRNRIPTSHSTLPHDAHFMVSIRLSAIGDRRSASPTEQTFVNRGAAVRRTRAAAVRSGTSEHGPSVPIDLSHILKGGYPIYVSLSSLHVSPTFYDIIELLSY